MTGSALSVVVIGRNEGSRLRRCLTSIAPESALGSIAPDSITLESIGRSASSGDPPSGAGSDAGAAAPASGPGNSDPVTVQVIYVDSSSTDGSPELARSFGAEVVVLHAERPTAALGRNAGWQRAQAEYVLFLDGDTILDANFPAAALQALERDPSIAAVWGHRREIHPEQSVYNRVLDLDWIYPPGESAFCGGDVVMRRAALEEAGGYDPNLIAGEEPELCRRLRARGYRILHIDAPMTGHDLQMTGWRQYWRRATRAGHAYAEVSSRFRASADPFWSAESQRNLLRGGFWIVSLLIALAALVRTPWVLAVWVLLLLLLSARSAWKSRWKVPGRPSLLLLYGFHSHLQQVPIFFGQLRYFLDRRAGRRRRLIEYKS